MKPFLLLLLVHLGLFRRCLGKKCYYPGGKEATGDFPCDADAEHSPCCAGTPLGLACLANKLCLSPAGRFARGSCTDPTWESPECPKFCTHQTGRGWDLVSCANVTQTDTFYCCNGMADCCSGGIGRQKIEPPPSVTWATWDPEQTRYDVVTPLETQSSSTTTSSSSPFSFSSSHPTGTPSQSTESNPSPTSETGAPEPGDSTSAEPAGLSRAAQAGIGVGAVVGALLVAAVAYLWWKLNRTQKALAAANPAVGREEDKDPYQQPQPPAQQQQQYQYYHGPARPPPPTADVKHELQAEPEHHELQAQNYFVRGHPGSAELSGSLP
ncbi:hypothetical protein VTH06DRAFT_4610 [Thermothelomyces fergusii]